MRTVEMGEGAREALVPKKRSRRRMCSLGCALCLVMGAYPAYCGVRFAVVLANGMAYMKEMRHETVDALSINGNPLSWYRVNDVVMGGHSTSTIRRLADGGLNFSGVISTRDGGFASCSTIEQPLHFPANLAAFNVSVTGNGELYKLTFKTSDSIWEPIWQADLPRASLVKGVRHNFLLPLSSFKANRMGSPVSESRLLASEIVSIGLNLALIDENGDPNPHFESGPFELLVHRIDLVTSHPQARELPTTVVPAADGGASNPAAVIAAAPSSPSSQLLVSFGRAASGTATWLVTNDPVMGGRSHASLAVGESSSTFNGTCGARSFL